MYPKNHIARIKEYNHNFLIKERFAGGMSNYTYKVYDPTTTNSYVFRIKGENGEKFVNYNQETFNLKLIDPLKISSKTIATFPLEGIKISSFISGNPLTTINYNKIATILKKLHNSKIVMPNDYKHLQRLTQYEQYHMQTTSEYLELKNQWLVIFNEHLKIHTNYPCHNDAQKSNFIESQDQYFLLDWEFSATNDYIYDLASFGNQNFSDACLLLEAYSENPSKNLYVRLYGWRIFQCLQWYNVAWAKDADGLSAKLNIPFDQVAKKYLKTAETLLSEITIYLK